MSESAKTFEPLARYVSDPSTLRKALDEANAIVNGLWTLSVFVDNDEAFLNRLKRATDDTLTITIPHDTNWTPISVILEKNDYQLCADQRGLGFVRKNNDNVWLKLYKKNLDWKDKESHQFEAMAGMIGKRLGGLMTSKYAVLVCELQTTSADKCLIEDLRKAIVTRYRTSPKRSDKERWGKLANVIYSVVELDGLASKHGSFNMFLSTPDILSKLSEWHQMFRPIGNNLIQN